MGSGNPWLYLGQTSRTIHDTSSSARIQNIKAARRMAPFCVLALFAECTHVRLAWWQGGAG